MNKVEIITFSAVFAVIAVRLYQKYLKKEKGKSEGTAKSSSGSMSTSSSKDDAYEPYSKK